jgi:hypothetical protein
MNCENIKKSLKYKCTWRKCLEVCMKERILYLVMSIRRHIEVNVYQKKKIQAHASNTEKNKERTIKKKYVKRQTWLQNINPKYRSTQYNVLHFIILNYQVIWINYVMGHPSFLLMQTSLYWPQTCTKMLNHNLKRSN